MINQLSAALRRMLNAYEADKAHGVAFGNDQAADEARAALEATKPIAKDKRKYLQCDNCSSFDVIVDANARWSAKRGRWELHSNFDMVTCLKCEHESDDQHWVDHATFTDLQQLAQDEASEARGLAIMEGRLDEL